MPITSPLPIQTTLIGGIKVTYQEQINHPLWQKKRLEVMQFNDFTCEQCGETETQLHVHHKLYHKGANIWEYDNSELRCLCKDCHSRFHDLEKRIKHAVSFSREDDLWIVLGYIESCNQHIAYINLNENSIITLENYGLILGMLDFYIYIKWVDLYPFLKRGSIKTSQLDALNRKNKTTKKEKITALTKIQTFLDVFPSAYQNNPSFVHVWQQFVEDRKIKKHPITKNAATIIANKLRVNCKGDMDWATDCVQQSIENSYRGVFIKAKVGGANKQQEIVRPDDDSVKEKRKRNWVGCYPH